MMTNNFSTAWMNLDTVQSALKKYEKSETSYFMILLGTSIKLSRLLL